MNKKIIIGVFVATIFIMLAFAPAAGNQSDINHTDNIRNNAVVPSNIILSSTGEQVRASSIANSYNLKSTGIIHYSRLSSNAKMVETFYTGKNYKGYLVSLVTSDKLQSAIFVLAGNKNNNTVLILIPVKSTLLDKTDVIEISSVEKDKPIKNISPDSAHFLCYSFYLKFTSSGKINGALFSFDNENTGRLVSYLAGGGAISGVIRTLIGRLAGEIVSAVLETLSDVLLAAFAAGVISAAIIEATNAYGEYVGFYMGYDTGWFNIPYPIFSYNPVPNGYEEVLNCEPINL